MIAALQETRDRTLALIANVGAEDLERVHSTLMSPLVWDLGHIAAFEDLWLVHRFGRRPLLREDLACVYDAFETPRAHRGDLPLLGCEAAHEYLAQVRSRTLEVIEAHGTAEVHEMVVRHECQHTETMLQTIELARLDGFARVELPPSPDPGLTGLETVFLPAGGCSIGAQPGQFSYDNERPRHRTDTRAFLIGRVPITNASYLTFVEGGGYERREWWSDEGWAWKEQYDITRPQGWTADHGAEWQRGKLEPLHPDRPVVHVSWFEADAFARAHGARLPTEVEWEKAATWNQPGRYPWGDEALVAGVHANVDQVAGGPAAAGAYPAGAAPSGCLGMIGDVWEWTSSDFTGYPGFVAHPYPEYSEVFFGSAYKVLRGGSWATRARVASPSFRNWDFPERRQIFAGFRIARDV
jgi:gamma-glutamyl hercynylcysteine S-oxide synthase